MSRKRVLYLPGLLIALPIAWQLLAGSALAQDFRGMAAKLPDSANVLTQIDVAGLMKSNLAKAQGWDQKHNMDYYAGKVSFPPSAKVLLMASQYSPADRRSLWEAGLVEFSEPIDIYVVAQKEGSEVEWIEKVHTVASRRNVYFLQFDRTTIGMFAPANRQLAARWVQSVKENKSAGPSGYLKDSVQRGGEFGQISIAFDLSNLLTYAEARNRLRQSPAAADAAGNLDAWTKFLAEIKGIRLAIKVDNAYTAELAIDCSENVEPFASILQGMVIEALGKLGFSSSEMGAWRSEMRGKTYFLRGPLEADEVKRIMALVLPSMPSVDRDADIPADQRIAVTSQRYLQAVRGLLGDLRTKSDQLEKTKQYTSNALWHEAMARKLDQLPQVNTDEALQQFSARTAARLRIMAESLRGIDIQNKVLDSYLRTDQSRVAYDGWGNYYGGYSWSNWREIESAKVENAAKGAKDRNLLWRQIGDEATNLRKEMSEKYKIEF